MTYTSKYLKAKVLWHLALGDVMNSGNPDVGPVVANTSALKAIIDMAANGKTEEIRKAGITGMTKVFGSNIGDVEVYEMVSVEIKDAVEMETREIPEELKEKAASIFMDRVRHAKWTRENLMRMYEDVDALGKMLGGFSIDSAKKSGVFDVPYLDKCRMYVTVQWRKNDANNFGLKLLTVGGKEKKAGTKDLAATFVGSNGLEFHRFARKTKPFYMVGRRETKYAFMDDVSTGLEIAMENVGQRLIEFFGSVNLPEFPAVLKDYILRMMSGKNEWSKLFVATFMLVHLYMEIWNSMTSWKRYELDQSYVNNGFSVDKDEEAAIKASASHGFELIRKDLRRGIRSLWSNTYPEKDLDPLFVSAVALAVSYMDKDGKAWISDEVEAKNFAQTALAEETNLYLYLSEKHKGEEVTEFVEERLELQLCSRNLKEGMKLNFIDGFAKVLDEEEAIVSTAKAVDRELEGEWETFINEYGKLAIRRTVEDVLRSLIPVGDERYRVFVSNANQRIDNSVNTLGDALHRAQVSGKSVYLVEQANTQLGNASTGQAVVVDGEIVGEYRIPRFQNAPSHRQQLIDAVGACRGEVDRYFSYPQEEVDGNGKKKVTWITVCVLRNVVRLHGSKERFLYNNPDRRTIDLEAFKARKAKKLQEAQDSISSLASQVEFE